MGAVLNSKSEFNRCYIPRLRVVEEDEASEMEKSEENNANEIEGEIMNNLKEWEMGKRRIRKSNNVQKSVSVKNPGRDDPEKEGRAPKRMKFPLITGWGEENTEVIGNSEVSRGEEYTEGPLLNRDPPTGNLENRSGAETTPLDLHRARGGQERMNYNREDTEQC